MAETEVAVGTTPDDNPFLKALHQYKQGKSPTSTPQSSGAVNPFADLSVKKKMDGGNVSAPTAQPSNNGGDSGQDFNPFPQNPQLQQDQQAAIQQLDKQNAPTAQQKQLSDALDAYKQAQGQNITTPTTKPDEIKQYIEPSILQKAGFAGKTFLTGLTEGGSDVKKGIQQIGDDMSSSFMHMGENIRGDTPEQKAANAQALANTQQITHGGLNPDIAKQVPGGLSNPFDLNKEYLETGSEAHPILAMAHDLAKMIPAIAGADATGGATFALQGIGSTAKVVDKLKEQGVSFNNGSDKLFIYGSGLINYALGKSVFGTVLSKASSGIKEDIVNSLAADVTKELVGKSGEVTSKDVASAFYDRATQFGQALQERGASVLEKYPIIGSEMAAANVATVGLKAATNALNGEQIFKEGASLKDIPGAAISPFYNNYKAANGDLGQFVQNLIATPAVGFSALGGLHRGKEPVNLNNPVEKQKIQLSQKISAIDADLKNLEPIASSETDPVKKTEAEVGIENLTKMKDEAYKALKGVIKDQHTQIQKEVNEPSTPTEPPVKNGVPETPKENVTQPTNEKPENNIGGIENAIQEQGTGKVGIRNASEVRQEVGENDRPIKSSEQGTVENGRTETKANDVEEKQLAKTIDNKAKELKAKDNATTAKLKEQKADIIEQMQEVHEALNGDSNNVEAIKKAGFEVDENDKVIFHVKDDGIFKVHKDWFVGTDGIDQIKKEFPDKIQNASTNKSISTPKRSTERQLAESRTDLEATERRLQDAKDNLTEAKRLNDEKMAKVWNDEVDREQRVYDIAKNIDYKPLKTTENESTNEKNGKQQSGQEGRQEGGIQKEEPISTKEEVASKAGKVIVRDNNLLQPSKFKGTDHHLALGELPDGKWGIVDTSTGLTVSKSYEDQYTARLAYSKNREKLTPEKLAKATEALDIQDESKAKVNNLNDKGKIEVDKDLKPNGITTDQIRDYEQSRTKPVAGLPANDTENVGRIQEDVRPANDKSGSTDENTKSAPVRERSEKSAGAVKREQYLEQSKKELSQALKKARSETNIGVNPELLKSMAKVIKAYADIGIHKFVDMVKDWIKTYHDTTDEDVEALKSAYAAHVATLEPKERKSYNDLKELDQFMAERNKPTASLPTYEKKVPRLPVPKEEVPEAEQPKLKKGYSKLSALKSYSVRNLEQLKAFSKDIKDFDAYRAVRKYATSKSQASVILKTATQSILKQVGKEGWQKIREALVESRLQGIRNRWNNYAEEAQGKTDNEIAHIFDDGKDGNMYDLVKNLHPLQGEANPADFAVSLVTSGRYDDARKYLSNIFRQAADNVLTLGIPFDEMVKDGKFVDPKMEEALQTYKSLLEKPIAESHESNEGIFSDDLGPLDTYYPLTGENMNDKARLIAKGKPFNQPSNINNKFATGQSDNYSTAVSDLSDKLTASIKTNNKANALEALKKVGLITDVAHNAPETEKMQVGNDMWDFKKEKVGESRTIIDNNGKIINTPSKYVMMPTWLKGELEPVFNSTDQYDKYNAVGKVMNVLTKVALGGPTEAIAHSYRMLGVITNSVPFMQEWAYKNGIVGEAGGYVANNPFVKKVTGMIKILNTDISSDKALKTIQEMSKLGIIPEKTWTKTWSREFAELNGAKASRLKIGKLDIPNITDFSPILYGKHSVDLKARVMMYNLVKAMNPEATPEQHVKMQNELGVYTKALQGQLERQIKETGLAPYYTFGSSVYRTAFKAITGTNPLPIDASKPGNFVRYKAAQLLTNGIIGSAASWMLTYHAVSGQWPWEDETSKLGRIPFPEWAKNDLTAKIFTDSKGEWKDINMLAINNPIVERGLRVIGAEKAYETNQLGGVTGQNIEAGATQAVNTLASPFTSSPALQALTTGIFGSAPYMTALRDDKGKPSPQFFNKVKATPFGTQNAANVYSAFKEVNPLVDLAITQTNKVTGMEKSIFGLNSVTKTDTQNEGVSPLGFVLNMAFPRFFIPHGNDDAKAHFIGKQQEDLQKTIAKEQAQEEE